jgi:hypothetical protein
MRSTIKFVTGDMKKRLHHSLRDFDRGDTKGNKRTVLQHQKASSDGSAQYDTDSRHRRRDYYRQSFVRCSRESEPHSTSTSISELHLQKRAQVTNFISEDPFVHGHEVFRRIYFLTPASERRGFVLNASKILNLIRLMYVWFLDADISP